MTGETSGEVLADRGGGRVVRAGSTVRRPLAPQSRAVHALLGHLDAVGFDAAPRVVDVEANTEVLTYIDGESGPDGWAKVVNLDGLRAAARLLRRYHDAVRRWQPLEPSALVWADGTNGSGDGDDAVVCHGDVGPWNMVWDGLEPVGLIDWDYAHVAPALSDVAYALEYMAPFRSDEEAVRWLRHPGAPDRRARIEVFAQAYGLTSTEGLAEAVEAEQCRTRDLVRSLAERGESRQVAMVADGYLTELDARIDWTRTHRDLTG